MTDPPGAHTRTVGTSDDIKQLQSRIRELERELRSRSTGVHDPSYDSASTERWKKSAAALAGMNVVLAVPAFITVRRWFRWWTE